MIFIGPHLFNKNAHFVTNIIGSIGTDHDLIIDLKLVWKKEDIFEQIHRHLLNHHDKYVIYNAYEDEDFFIEFKKYFPNLVLFTFFSDDEWRHFNYDRYLALYSDFYSIALSKHLQYYSNYGLLNVTLCQWACNPKVFYPRISKRKKYNVSFIGAAYGKRIDYIRFLVHYGVDVNVFGKGWNKFNDIKKYWGGYLSKEEMLNVINRSMINLNFLWTSHSPNQTTIKGRSMEIAACNAFQLSTYTDEFENYEFQEGVNIATFKNKQEMVEKIKYYLNAESERKRIAEAAYQLVLKKHTWEHRFIDIFRIIKEGRNKNEFLKYNILVVLFGNVSHNINIYDERMSVTLVSRADVELKVINKYDGVVLLENNSTINNETLLMMAFAIKNDQSDMVLTNFYIHTGWEKARIWIRFRDRYIDKKRKKIDLLPVEAKMFSSKTAPQFIKKKLDYSKSSISYIEYPTFTIRNLGILQKRRLKLLFGHYDKKVDFIKNIKSFRLFNALNILFEYLFQKKWILK